MTQRFAQAPFSDLTLKSSSAVFVPIVLPSQSLPASANNLQASRPLFANSPQASKPASANHLQASKPASATSIQAGNTATIPAFPGFSGSGLEMDTELPASILTAKGLRLRIETFEAQRKEALQRVVDLQRLTDGALRTTNDGDAEEIGRSAALEAATQDLLSINRKQNELEIAFAKASAREALESRLQTACGGCLQYKQKVDMQRAELDRQFEALRAEMAASAAELERGKREAQAAAVADASRQEAEAARARMMQAQAEELEELRRRSCDTKDALRVLELRALELADKNRAMISAQQDLNLKYQNVGEGCVKAFSDTTAMQQMLSAVEPSVNIADQGAARASAEINRIRQVLEEIRLAATETSDSAQSFAPFAEERLRNGEMQIAELTEAFKALEGKHAELGDVMRNNTERVDNIEKEVEKVTSWTLVSNGGG